MHIDIPKNIFSLADEKSSAKLKSIMVPEGKSPSNNSAASESSGKVELNLMKVQELSSLQKRERKDGLFHEYEVFEV